MAEQPQRLGALLRRLRERAGMTRADVQRRMRCGRTIVWWWESADGGRPSSTALHRLLDLYGASDAERLLAWRLRAEGVANTDAGVVL